MSLSGNDEVPAVSGAFSAMHRHYERCAGDGALVSYREFAATKIKVLSSGFFSGFAGSVWELNKQVF
ncbi:MAG TPA: hypothetical protein VLG39_08660 [Nitrospirota bacterium]|nr:hypothetical protein [Nitrospirota bacterium]